MATRPNNATPARKQQLGHTRFNSANRSNGTQAPATYNMKSLNVKDGTLLSLLTPRKASISSDDEDQEGEGGGVPLTPQPRPGDKAQNTVNYQEHNASGGGVSLSASRLKDKPSCIWSAEPKSAKSVTFFGTDTIGANEHNHDYNSSDEEAQAAAPSLKTATTSSETQGLSPHSVSTDGNNAYTPHSKIWNSEDAKRFVKTVPVGFAPRPVSRPGLTNEPPPSFDLGNKVSNLVGHVITNAGHVTPGSVKSTGTGAIPSPSKSADVFQRKPVPVALGASSTFIHRGNGHYKNSSLATTVSGVNSPMARSSIVHRDSLGSFTGLSPGQLQKRPELHNNVGLQQIIEQTREAFAQLPLSQQNTQPTTFDYGGLKSEMLNYLTGGFTTLPAVDIALSQECEPFIENALRARPSSYPVLKIEELPYEAKVSDIIAFVGGNAKILNDADEPVHVMMERITAKTGSAYVEFYDFESAIKVVDKHHQAKAHGKPIRISTRIVSVSISSQDALLKDLFPYARQVTWVGGQPRIDVPPQEFKGFVTEEELISLCKNVEFPQRVPYTKACPQRSVETLISILKKLPWQMTAYITVRQRYRIYKAVTDMMHTLFGAIHNFDRRANHDHTYASEMLNEKLLKRLTNAALGCPGFTPLMKDNIACLVGWDGYKTAQHNLHPTANRWRHLYALTPNPVVPADVIDYYIAIIREETTRMVNALPPMLRRQVCAMGNETDPYWGYFWAVVGYPEGDEFEKMSLHQCAAMEITAIDNILCRALPAQQAVALLTQN